MADKPKRVQMQRTKGWRKPEGTIYVGRPTKWGNPIRVGDMCEVQCWGADDGLTYPTVDVVITPAIAVAVYEREWRERLRPFPPGALAGDVANWQRHVDALAELRGHDLACWCPLVDAAGNPVPCHADVLLRLANT